ncbi:hypothetical protein I302_102710 [Kwoniella bestiolae CBS 10118]|uniref:Amino acid transporter transmembrane domain-containing protein n=1 Tax=Kwoniella bestiolae CBS 10118 TaxID=1296100 RepID=A0A1B9GFQ8_9TREE|nr:hypothetical protein I302_01403 [Kwoniella bestiolae CBS 10118]OCF29890.1 hypothetical protein I302_01403 [Kwoniella bestiolae CBS 10118]
MTSPRGGVPIPAVPVPSPQDGSTRKKGKAAQLSSLELVFSFSRHQQMRYGQSVPSFIESSSSRSHSSPSRNLDGSYQDEDRDVSHRWADIEAAAGGDAQPGPVVQAEDPEIIFEEEQGHSSEQGRRPSDDPSFFVSDPVPASRQIDTTPLTSSQASPVQQSINTTEGLISFNMFSPRVTSSHLSTSLGTRSSGSQTPLPSKAGRGTTRMVVHDHDEGQLEGADETAPLVKSSSQREYGTVTVEAANRKATTMKKRVYHPVGQSTDGQTLFNATAVLVGIGLLSMPLAFAYAGWIGGTIMLLSFGWLTCHTAKLLARLIRSDPTLMGYTDIGVRALGAWAGGGIHILFCLELFALGVALVVLFGDTLNALYPEVSPNYWKLFGFFVILPTALLPLRLLSLPSLLSSVSSLLLVLVLLIDGLIRPTAPGSLRDPMVTSLWPESGNANWLGGIGLILAGFGGHAVMPSLARDMKTPESFDKVVNKAFAIATAISFIAGAAGYLMIGPDVSDEITRDLMQDKYHYPHLLNLVALWMIVINPLTKFGLSSRPLNISIENILGISPAHFVPPADESAFYSSQVDRVDPLDSGAKSDRNESRSPLLRSPESRTRGMGESDWSYRSIPHQRKGSTASVTDRFDERRKAVFRIVSRTVVTALCVGTAVLLPGFGRVMAFLGSFSAFAICIILPLLFYLKLAPRLDPTSESTPSARLQKMIHWILVGICTALMIAGTVWAFLPGSGHGELNP